MTYIASGKLPLRSYCSTESLAAPNNCDTEFFKVNAVLLIIEFFKLVEGITDKDENMRSNLNIFAQNVKWFVKIYEKLKFASVKCDGIPYFVPFIENRAKNLHAICK